MSLTLSEQVALWAPPILMLLLTGMYYLRWGKEANDDTESEPSRTALGGDH